MINNKPSKENNRKNPLEELIEDESQASSRGESILKDLIQPYAYIGKNSKDVQLRDETFGLPPKLRVVLLFLGKLAAKQLGLIPDESLAQKEVIGFFTPHGVPEGTIKVTLKQLRDDRMISKTSQGRYATGFDKLSKIQAEFTKYGRKAT